MRAKGTFIKTTIFFLLFNLSLKLTAAESEEKTNDLKKIVIPYAIPTDCRNNNKTVSVNKKNSLEGSEDDDSEGEEDSSKSDEKCHFWGNSYSLKFHLKSCPFAQAMNPRHVQFLKNAKEALKLGERPCRYCLPPYTLDVSCKLLTRPTNDNQSDNSEQREIPGNGL